ncbi:MAG TPA: protein kinase [Polyangium sp.]|nr:protein kinase [Polyangium sp.]
MRVGDVIDERFEILAVAGAGGMGTVYRARDRHLGVQVAIKSLRDPRAGDVARFASEARLLAELDHPHIVKYVTHGATLEGDPYLAMEWLNGESLDARLRRETPTLPECTMLARQVASALEMAHARGIVHRDIKPSNLFLLDGSFANTKLLDFGIARFEAMTTPLTRTGNILGTPGYMAPEQARGDRGQIDARADIFAFGCVLFECLTGQPAFQGVHIMALLAKLLMEEPPRVEEIRPDVPRGLARLVSRMLAKDPAKRPADGHAIAEELQLLDQVGAGDHAKPFSLFPPSSDAESITVTEKRLISVVAVTQSEPLTTMGSATTLPATNVIANLLPRVRQVLEPFGAAVEELANGVLLVLLVGSGPPTDRAALAARSAFRIRALLPDAPIVLLTGRSEETGRLPVGEVLERAASLLIAAGAKREGQSLHYGPIHIDELTRALLDVRFVVTNSDFGGLLHEEREIGGEARTLLGRPSPFVGRERELAHICSFIEESIEERTAHAIVMTSPAGMGKSRIRYEMMRRIRERHPDLVFAVGRAESISAGSPFALIGSAFRGVLGISAGESIESQRAKITSSVSFFVPDGDRDRVREFLGELIGVPFPDETSPKLRAARQNASIMADQIQAAFIDFTGAVARKRPAFLVLEDLHWGDGPSVKLIDAALRELEDVPFVVAAFGRTELHDVFPKLWHGRRHTEIRLNVLGRKASESLVREMLGDSATSEVVTKIVDRASGNAFYLEELIRAVAQGRGESLPETVLGMVEARLAALEPESRRLLRAASIFGNIFWRAGVAKLLGEDKPSSVEQNPFAALVENEVLLRRVERRFAHEEEFAFRHSLLREGAYAMLTDRDRVIGHKLAAEWLEQIGEQDPQVLAEHFDRGGEAARAAKYHLKAAEIACEGNDYATAIALADRAIAASTDSDLLADAWALRSEVTFWHADPAQAVISAEKALALARPGSRSDCRALGWSVAGALFSGRIGLLDTVIERLLRTDPDPDAIGVLASGFNSALMYLVSTAQRDRIERSLRRLEYVTKDVVETDPLVAAWVAYNRATWERTAVHDWWAALEYDCEATAHFDRSGAKRHIPYAQIYAGQDYSLLGMFDRGDEVISAALRDIPEGTVAALLGTYFKAFALLGRRNFDEATEKARYVIETAAVRGDKLLRLLAGVVMVEVELERNHIDRAEKEALDILDIARTLPYQGMLHSTVLARIRLHQGQAPAALEIANEALAQSRKLGMGHHLRHRALLLVHAQALQATGAIEAARAEIRESRDWLHARAEKIPNSVVRRSFLENVRENAQTIQLAAEWGL